eukprot:gene14087-18643_t
MVIDVRTHLDLLDLDDLLVLARLGRLLLVGVLQLAEIEDLYDGRDRIGRYFDQIEPGLFGEQQCVVDGNIAAVLAFGVDKLDPGNPDITVGARPILGRRRCFERSANGRGLLGRFVPGFVGLMSGRANVKPREHFSPRHGLCHKNPVPKERPEEIAMTATPPTFLDVDGSRIAVRHAAGSAPGIVWLGGYKSDMLGTKAQTLADWAAKEGRAFLRHDYSGHGESGGAFAD